MKALGIILAIAGIVGLLICGGIYLFMTKTVEITTVPITIEKATYYVGQTSAGFFGPKEAYYSQIQAEPTANAKPNTDYLITTNNGLTAQTYSVSWNNAELTIYKAKTITDRISQDAYTALQQKSQYTVNIVDRKPQHNMLFIVPGILFFVLGLILYVISVAKEPVTRDPWEKWMDVTNDANKKESKRAFAGAVVPSTNLNANELPPESNSSSTSKQPIEPNIPYEPPLPVPKVGVIYVGPNAQADSIPPPEVRLEKTRELAFNTLNNLSRDGVLNPSEVREWHTKIEQATSETSLNGYIKTLNSIEEGEPIYRDKNSNEHIDYFGPLDFWERQKLNRLASSGKIHVEELGLHEERLVSMSPEERQAYLSDLEHRNNW